MLISNFVYQFLLNINNRKFQILDSLLIYNCHNKPLLLECGVCLKNFGVKTHK